MRNAYLTGGFNIRVAAHVFEIFFYVELTYIRFEVNVLVLMSQQIKDMKIMFSLLSPFEQQR